MVRDGLLLPAESDQDSAGLLRRGETGCQAEFWQVPCGGVSTKGSSGGPGESLEMVSTVTGFAAFDFLFRPFAGLLWHSVCC